MGALLPILELPPGKKDDRMKRILALLLCVVLALALCACSKADTDEHNTFGTPQKLMAYDLLTNNGCPLLPLLCKLNK